MSSLNLNTIIISVRFPVIKRSEVKEYKWPECLAGIRHSEPNKTAGPRNNGRAITTNKAVSVASLVSSLPDFGYHCFGASTRYNYVRSDDTMLAPSVFFKYGREQFAVEILATASAAIAGLYVFTYTMVFKDLGGTTESVLLQNPTANWQVHKVGSIVFNPEGGILLP